MKKAVDFFSKNPALLLAFGSILGAEASIQKEFLLLICILPIFWLASDYKVFFLCPIIMIASFFLTDHNLTLPSLPDEGLIGQAHITIDKLCLSSNSHGSNWIYKGRICSFNEDPKIMKGVPFYLSLPGKRKNRPLADCDYRLDCSIKKGYGHQVIIKPTTPGPWTPLESYSFAEKRFQLKVSIKKWIEKHFSSLPTINFLSGLVIGEFDDRQLSSDFKRFGLLHLLAISGFHFSILANMLQIFLRPFFSARPMAYILIFLLSLYFLFLGWGPSILRAWFTLILYLAAFFQERFTSPMNSLGLALLFSSFMDPLLLEHLGFQFSFLTTAAILMGLAPCQKLLDGFSPKRSFEEVLKWSKLEQMFYILLGFMKNGLSLSLATTFIALPLSLYYFEQFPLLSLFYNIFFPFLVSISMGLLLIALSIFFLPPLANSIHFLNDYFTSFILNMTYEIPKISDISITSPKIPLFFILFYLFVIFFIAIYTQKSKKQLEY